MSKFNLLMNNPSFTDKVSLISGLLTELRQDLNYCMKNGIIAWNDPAVMFMDDLIVNARSEMETLKEVFGDAKL